VATGRAIDLVEREPTHEHPVESIAELDQQPPVETTALA
jgi:hypothetical protein